MPQTIKDGWSFPQSCPACSQVAGMPFMAATVLENSGIKVAMRCGKCGHEWRFDMPVTTEPKRNSGSHPPI